MILASGSRQAEGRPAIGMEGGETYGAAASCRLRQCSIIFLLEVNYIGNQKRNHSRGRFAPCADRRTACKSASNWTE